MKFSTLFFIVIFAAHFSLVACNCTQWFLKIGALCCKQNDTPNPDRSQSPNNFQHGNYIFMGDKMQPVTPSSLSAQILIANAQSKPVSFTEKPTTPKMHNKENQP